MGDTGHGGDWLVADTLRSCMSHNPRFNQFATKDIETPTRKKEGAPPESEKRHGNIDTLDGKVAQQMAGKTHPLSHVRGHTMTTAAESNGASEYPSAVELRLLHQMFHNRTRNVPRFVPLTS